MTNEERDIIGQFIARVGGAAQPSGFASGSVPATQPAALPPVDRDADAFIGQSFTQYPEARYRITQLAFVQEHALAEAQNRIQRLEWELQQAQQAAQQTQQSAAKPAGGGGFFGSLFGTAARPQQAPPQGGDPRWGGGQAAPGYQSAPPQQPYYQQAAPPPPQYPPNYQQGMFQQRGSGFLGSALTTAAGVAGGMVAGEALMSLFSPHRGFEGGGAFGGYGGGPGASPWASPPPPNQDYVDTGSWDQGGGASPASNQDYVDNGTWDQPTGGGSSGGNDGGWDSGSGSDNSGGSDGGWDSGDSGSGNSDDTF